MGESYDGLLVTGWHMGAVMSYTDIESSHEMRATLILEIERDRRNSHWWILWAEGIGIWIFKIDCDHQYKSWYKSSHPGCLLWISEKTAELSILRSFQTYHFLSLSSMNMKYLNLLVLSKAYIWICSPFLSFYHANLSVKVTERVQSPVLYISNQPLPKHLFRDYSQPTKFV